MSLFFNLDVYNSPNQLPVSPPSFISFSPLNTYVALTLSPPPGPSFLNLLDPLTSFSHRSLCYKIPLGCLGDDKTMHTHSLSLSLWVLMRSCDDLSVFISSDWTSESNLRLTLHKPSGNIPRHPYECVCVVCNGCVFTLGSAGVIPIFRERIIRPITTRAIPRKHTQTHTDSYTRVYC